MDDHDMNHEKDPNPEYPLDLAAGGPVTREEEICLLAEASLRGDITDQEAQRLEELLAGDAKEHRKFYLRYILQTVSLRVWSASFAEFGEGNVDAVDAKALAPRSRAGGQGASLGSLFRQYQKYLAIAAAALVAVGVGLMYLPQGGQIEAFREPQPIASLTADQQAKWAPGRQWKENASLMEGDVLELAEGRAQVSMACGAELVLKGPCSLVVSSSNEVTLHNGVLSVGVADWTNRFSVTSGEVRIMDLGKQFVVSANAQKGTVEAHAIDGNLRVQTMQLPEEQPRGLLVASGEAIRIHSALHESKRLKADAALFDPGFAATGPFKPIDISNTGRGLMVGDEDPNWRIVSSSLDSFSGSQYAVVCAALEPQYLPGNASESQWISSRVDTLHCPPSTMWTFETEVDLSGYDLSSVTLAANVIADNGVTAVRINGRPVAMKPWIEIDSKTVFNSYRKIEINEGMVEGINQIQFDVWNGVLIADVDKHNPMGFRVEWQAYGRLKSLDANLATRTQRPARSLVRSRAPWDLPPRPEKHSEADSPVEFLSLLGIVHPG